MARPSDHPIRDLRAGWRRAARPGLDEIDADRFAELVATGRDLRLGHFRTPDLEHIRWPEQVVGGDVQHADIVSIEWIGRKGRPASMTDVTFDDCVIDPFEMRDAVLTRCTFNQCSFGLYATGAINDGAIVDSTFRGCLLGEWYVNGSRFERTRFTAIKSGTLSFTGSTFTEVSFSGRPGVLDFDECRFDDLDISDANPKRLEIRRPGRGSRARMFDRPDHFVVAAADLPPLLPIARAKMSDRAFADFAIFVESYGPPSGVRRLTQERPTHVDVRPGDVVRESEASDEERAALVNLVREQRIRVLEIS
jgi:uncharacterized protein YjbI with pentapeptide repeats